MSLGTIKDFFNGKTVLITGATGFIGRLLLAKLMRMGNVKEILLLSRPKKGKSNEERLNKILSGFLFEEMEKFDVTFKRKLRLVNADMELEDLGMSEIDRDYVINSVEIIIHGAATVRFDEELRKAITINIRGTKNMLELATEIKYLRSFVHISTAYSQCPRSEIKESFYKPPMDYHQAIDLLDLLDGFVAEAITAKLVAPWPNTYTFTKAISEDMVRQFQDRLPIGIIRPTIVVATMKDPVKGYADSILGMLGVTIGAGLGLIRVSKAIPSVKMDLVPADIVVNYALVVAWKTARKLKGHDAEDIYNCPSGDKRGISITDLHKMFPTCFSKYPLSRMMWFPTITTTSSEIYFRFLFFLYHYVPAYFIDLGLRIKGSKTRLVPIYSKIFYLTKLLTYFAERTWIFQDGNRKKIFQLMSEADHRDFPLRTERHEFASIHEDAVLGFSKYFFKESDADRERARMKYKLFYALHLCFLAVVYGILAYLIHRMFGDYCLRMLPVIEKL